MSKDFLSDHAARMAALRAVQTLITAVGATFGPRGGNVIIEGQAGRCPQVTRDGATVARSLELEDPFENLVARVICEGAERSARDTGDGTTTTVLLAAGVIQAGIKWTAAGHDPGALSRAVRHVSGRMQERLRSMGRSAQSGSDLERIATMTAGGDEHLGGLLAKALLSVGWDGDVTIDADAGTETDLEIVEGLRLPVSRIASELFPSVGTELKDCRLLLHDGTLDADDSLARFVKQLQSAAWPLVVVARGVGDGVASRLTAAGIRAERAPVLLARLDAREQLLPQHLDDLALFTGATVRIGAAGQSWPRDFGDLGSARLVRVARTELRVIDGVGSAAAIGERVEKLRAHLDHADPAARRALFRRTGRLAGRSAVLRVGAATEPALRELASRAESALSTTRAALEQGIVPGGGIALLRAAQATVHEQPENVGAQLLVDAAESLVSRLAENAGTEGRAVLEEVRSAAGPIGFHAGTGRIEDLEAAGVLDPLKVIRTALDNAVSVACAILEAGGLLTQNRPERTTVAEGERPQPNS